MATLTLHTQAAVWQPSLCTRRQLCGNPHSAHAGSCVATLTLHTQAAVWQPSLCTRRQLCGNPHSAHTGSCVATLTLHIQAAVWYPHSAHAGSCVVPSHCTRRQLCGTLTTSQALTLQQQGVDVDGAGEWLIKTMASIQHGQNLPPLLALVGPCPKGQYLPHHHTIAPHVRLVSVNLLPETLRCHPSHWHLEFVNDIIMMS